MPTALRQGPYRFHFYAGDREEPPHIHVRRDDNEAKFWLDPVLLAESILVSQHTNCGIFATSSYRIARFYWSNGVSISSIDLGRVQATRVEITDDALTVHLIDGRVISAPLVWYPRLLHGNTTERNHWELSGRGIGIHWPDLDEDISVANLLAGQPSGESQRSFKNWLDARTQKS